MMTQYRLRQIGHQLKIGTARIVGRSHVVRTPDYDMYEYVIEDLERRIFEYVDWSVRPSWKRYMTDWPGQGTSDGHR